MTSAPTARGITALGYADLGSRNDAAQVMVARGHAFLGHIFSRGIEIVDVRDPRAPEVVNYLPTRGRTWSPHLQTHDGLMIVAEEFDLRSLGVTRAEYYGGSVREKYRGRFGERGTDYTAGLRFYDITAPAEPKQIGFLETPGLGVHRLWWDGGRYAYASADLEGFSDHVLVIVDVADPARPQIVGRWWLPGMWTAGGEEPAATGRVALHHALVADGIAYASWRDAGLVVLDVSDPTEPTFLAQRRWSPPFAGGTHSTLPLPGRGLAVVAEEAGLVAGEEPAKYIWVMDVRCPDNPVSVSTFPFPAEARYAVPGAHFGPHNLHENRAGAFQSERYVFATYQSAGVRVYDIADQFRPEEVGYFVPGPPGSASSAAGWRPRSCDVFVDAEGLMYLSDYDCGLHILQWHGV